MNTGKFLIASVASAVFVFLLDFLWYGMLMANYFTRSAGDREEPMLLWIFAGILVFSLAFCHIYIKIVERPRGIKATDLTRRGASYGLAVSVLVFVSMAFVMYGVRDGIPFSEFAVDAIFRVVQITVLGVIVAHIIGAISARNGDKGSGDGDE